MDYSKLLKIAEGKRVEAQYERTTVAYCDTSIAPPKKVPKSNVQSDAIKNFLQKKKAEEYQKTVEAKKKKEELLALREMSRSKTKAKIMASRTKDNDFSKIRLTDEELEAKKRREQELIKLSLNDKVARMKARIEMEEQEKLLPKKRKRKSKDPNLIEDQHDDHAESHPEDDPYSNPNRYSVKETVNKKLRPPPPPSFHELLQLAEKKQYEPVKDLPIFKDDDSRPLSKKARKLLQEEENSIRRKLAAEAAEKKKSHSIENIPSENLIKKLPKIALKKRPASENLTPNYGEKQIVHRQVASEHKLSTELVRKDKTNTNANRRQPVNNISTGRSDNFLNKRPDQQRQQKNNSSTEIRAKPSFSGEKVRIAHKAKDLNGVQNNKAKSFENGSQNSKPNSVQSAKAGVSNSSMRRTEPVMKSKKISSEIVSKDKVAKSKALPQKTEKPLINEDLLAEIEKRVRSQVQKELEAKFLQQQKSVTNDVPKSQPVSQKPQVNEKSQIRTNPVAVKPPKVDTIVKKVRDQAPSLGEKRTLSSDQKPPQKFLSARPLNDRQSVVKRPPPPPPPQKAKLPPQKPMREEKPRKPAFHPNPYLQPPRRLLVSQLPQRPARRRLESDDDDDEDDDDMNEFIDDECGDSSENYSQYIKEIFGYDRSRYEDEDDDDVMETSFAEQMKEECRSAKIARKEDLEEELKEREEMRRKMLKKKQLKTKK